MYNYEYLLRITWQYVVNNLQMLFLLKLISGSTITYMVSKLNNCNSFIHGPQHMDDPVFGGKDLNDLSKSQTYMCSCWCTVYKLFFERHAH